MIGYDWHEEEATYAVDLDAKTAPLRKVLNECHALLESTTS